MSLEYVMDEYFSMKFDIYSFGVILLKIVSGKRSTRLLPSGKSLKSSWTREY